MRRIAAPEISGNLTTDRADGHTLDEVLLEEWVHAQNRDGGDNGDGHLRGFRRQALQDEHFLLGLRHLGVVLQEKE